MNGQFWWMARDPFLWWMIGGFALLIAVAVWGLT